MKEEIDDISPANVKCLLNNMYYLVVHEEHGHTAHLINECSFGIHLQSNISVYCETSQ